MIDLSSKKVNYIGYKYVGGEYGLQIALQFDNQEYLFFNSFQFSITSNTYINNFLEIENSKKLIGEFIVSIRQDESTNFFIEFSNNSILYIYQKIFDLENWEQDFKIVNETDLDYVTIKNHMYEDWIFESSVE